MPTQMSNLFGKPGMRVHLLMGSVRDLHCGSLNPNGDVMKTKGLEKASYLLGVCTRMKWYMILSDPCITLFFNSFLTFRLINNGCSSYHLSSASKMTWQMARQLPLQSRTLKTSVLEGHCQNSKSCYGKKVEGQRKQA